MSKYFCLDCGHDADKGGGYIWHKDAGHKMTLTKLVTVSKQPDMNIIYNDMSLTRLRDINTDSEGKKVKFMCKIMSMGELQTYIKSCEKFCSICDSRDDVYCDSERKLPNLFCHKCNVSCTIDRDTINSEFIRTVVVQEPLAECLDMKPIKYEAEVYGRLAKEITMGMDVQMIGQFRSRRIPRDIRNKIVFEIEAWSLKSTVIDLMPTQLELERYSGVGKDELIRDFAPEILGFDLVKEAAIISCVGGLEGSGLRGDINTLIMGDPSVGKTRILMFINQIVQRSAYTQGRSSSAAGLILGIDTLSDGTRIPSAGPVVLCNGGVVCIDEIDKMSTSDKVALHEVMEKQTATLNKIGGQGVTLPAKTTIIAAANPVGSKWDDGLSIIENIHFPESLLSRFGIKIKILDIADKEIDEAIARHQIRARSGGLAVNMKPEDYTKYFNFIRKLRPVITEIAENKLVKFYVDLRGFEQNQGSIPIDRRTNEDLIRISTAYAKIRMSKTVDEIDVDNAILFMKKCLETFGMNTSGEMKDKLMVTTKMNKQQYAEHCIHAATNTEGEIDEDYLTEMLFDGTHYKTRGDARNTVGKLIRNSILVLCVSGKYRYNPH